MPTYNIKLGRLNKRVDLQSKTRTKNSLSAKTGTWITDQTVWANIAPLRASERRTYNAMKETVDFEITIRFRATVKASWRISFTDPVRGTRIFEIKTVIDDSEDRRYLRLMCKEKF